MEPVGEGAIRVTTGRVMAPRVIAPDGEAPSANPGMAVRVSAWLADQVLAQADREDMHHAATTFPAVRLITRLLEAPTLSFTENSLKTSSS